MDHESSLSRYKIHYEMAEDGLEIWKDAAKRNRLAIRQRINEARRFIVAVSLVRLKK